MYIHAVKIEMKKYWKSFLVSGWLTKKINDKVDASPPIIKHKI